MADRIHPFEEIEEDDSKELDEPIEESQPIRVDAKALKLSLLGLLVLIAFQAVQLWSWNRFEARPSSWDQSIHLEIAHAYRQAVGDSGLIRALFKGPREDLPPFPPLYHLSLMHAVDDENPAASARWVNFFYITLLCLALWALGLHFAGEWPALGAAVLGACIPEVQVLLREHRPDLALISLVAAGYWCVAFSRSFRKLWPGLLFAGFFALSAMTTWTAFTYFIPMLILMVKGLRDKKARWNVLIVAAAALVLTVPWYVVRWADVVPAAFTMAFHSTESFWRGLAILSYMSHMMQGLEFPLFALSMVAFVQKTKRRRWEDTWLLFAWFVTAYFFWTWVPNRQIRLLLPGLIPLAVLTMGPWDKRVLIGLCSFQFLVAANYPWGWVPKIEFQAGVPLTVFRSEVPSADDWKVADILEAAAALHDEGTRFGSMTMLVRHPRFNVPVFQWEKIRRGYKDILPRKPNRRVCEFSEFLLTKTGSLGPPEAVRGLPKIREKILEQGTWFRQGYKLAGKWPLPDGSEAQLYQRRIARRAPFGEGRAVYHYFEEKNFKVERLIINFGKWDAQRGIYPRVRITADYLAFRGIEIKNLALVMDGLGVVTATRPNLRDPSWMRDNMADVRFLRLDRLQLLGGSAGEASVAAFIEGCYPKLKRLHFDFNDLILARARIHRIPVSIAVKPVLDEEGQTLDFHIKGLRVVGIPVPVLALGKHAVYRVPFAASAKRPFRLEIKGLRASHGKIRLGK